MVEEVQISEILEELRPVWKRFVVEDLGYSEEQGEQFAAGYEKELSKLPMTGKLVACEYMHEDCMDAGFSAAGIDPEEAQSRFNNRLEEDEEFSSVHAIEDN